MSKDLHNSLMSKDRMKKLVKRMTHKKLYVESVIKGNKNKIRYKN